MRLGLGNRSGGVLADDIAWADNIAWAAANGFALFDLRAAAPDAPTERGDWPASAALLRDE